MKHTEIRDMNKQWRKFRLQTNEEKVQESKIKSIINLVNEQNLKNLSEEELNNFYAEVKKITK
jgi:cell division FtsZ-interacting protein ZapD|tara:strand:- start:74 stop:262 length:189 start_codon:yes stop_codon:yes gene_type:complete